MKITLAVQNYLFEKRLCWLLSSVLQQTGNLPDITIDVAYAINSGNPKTKDVIDLFRSKGLVIITHVYPTMSDIQYRGITRNDQLESSTSDWMLFADVDHVYPPMFFANMKTFLLTDFKDNPHCLHSGRRSTFLEETERMINNHNYPCVIPNAFEEANKLEAKNKSLVGAGNMHLVNTRLLRANHDGLYVNPKRCRDKSWVKQYACARSDMQFRRKLGKENIPLPRAIHLQHVRSRDDRANLEVQK